MSLKNSLNVAFATALEEPSAIRCYIGGIQNILVFFLSILNMMKISFVYTSVPSARGTLGLIALVQ